MRNTAPKPQTHSGDDLACARHVIQNAHKLSLMTPEERSQILTLAWRVLDANRTTPPRPANTTGAAPNVTSLALWKARARIKARAEQRALTCTTTPRRPRIVVHPADPHNPGDAA